jgi:hypothetical protein
MQDDEEARLQKQLASFKASNAGAVALQKAEATSLNGVDIKTLLGRDIRVTAYPDLARVASVADILDSRGRGVVFFVESQSGDAESGHWTAIMQQGAKLLWCDSYGLQWDRDRSWLSSKDLVSLHESRPLLAQLFERSSMVCEYSPFKFQRTSPTLSTCGRTITRALACCIASWAQMSTRSGW